jgi:hypothetical protein
VVQPGVTVPVGRGDCRTAQECAEVTDVAVLDVQVGQQRQRAEAGELRLREVIPARRYAGSMTLSFQRGQLGGTFDVVPRPES